VQKGSKFVRVLVTEDGNRRSHLNAVPQKTKNYT